MVRLFKAFFLLTVLAFQAPLQSDAMIWQSAFSDNEGGAGGIGGLIAYREHVHRFLSPDPSRFADSRNLYAYCANDPINKNDPDGRLAKGAVAGATQGDYADYANPEQAFGGFLGQVGAGFTPAGWAGDVRDLTAAIGDVKSQGLGWGNGAGVVLGGVAFVPGVGDAIKGVLKPLIKAAEDVPVNSVINAVEESGGKPFAMGLDAELDTFAQARGATTWKQFPNPENWRSGVLDKLADPNIPVHFNLNGVDVWGGVQRAASGMGRATDWELLQIRQNPQFWDTMTYWKNGQVTPNPFK